jgi:hypothetical protein
VQSPALENKIINNKSLANPRRKGTASSPKGGLLCGVALYFFVMVFVSQRTPQKSGAGYAAAAHPRSCGVQPLQADPQTKTHA